MSSRPNTPIPPSVEIESVKEAPLPWEIDAQAKIEILAAHEEDGKNEETSTSETSTEQTEARIEVFDSLKRQVVIDKLKSAHSIISDLKSDIANLHQTLELSEQKFKEQIEKKVEHGLLHRIDRQDNLIRRLELSEVSPTADLETNREKFLVFQNKILRKKLSDLFKKNHKYSPETVSSPDPESARIKRLRSGVTFTVGRSHAFKDNHTEPINFTADISPRFFEQTKLLLKEFDRFFNDKYELWHINQYVRNDLNYHLDIKSQLLAIEKDKLSLDNDERLVMKIKEHTWQISFLRTISDAISKRYFALYNADIDFFSSKFLE